MSGHRHNPNADTQNQGNSLGDRACVRQSKLYRIHESGNNVKSLLGTSHLCWDQNQAEGAYKGHSVYDHTAVDPLHVNNSHAAALENPKYGRTRPRDNGSTSGNFYSGYGDEGPTDYRRGPIAGKAEPRRQSYGSSFETTSSGYGREGGDRIGKHGQDSGGYGGRGGADYGGRGGADYGGARASYDPEPPAYDSRRRASFDREPAQNDSRGRGGRGGGSYNDENANSMRNALSHYGGGESSNSYKDDRGSGGGAGGYRSLRDQLDNSSSSYQRTRQDNPAEEAQHSAIRTYKGQDRATRPW